MKLCRERKNAIEGCPISYVLSSRVERGLLSFPKLGTKFWLFPSRLWSASLLILVPAPRLPNSGSSAACHTEPRVDCHTIASSDDPAVFGDLGLSYHYFQMWSIQTLRLGEPFVHGLYTLLEVLVSSEVNGLRTLGLLARESLVVSCTHQEMTQFSVRLFLNADV